MERRRLTERERALLVALLEHASFPGRDALLAQVDHTWATEPCSCGCATVSLEVDEIAPRSQFSGVVPSEAELIAEDPLGSGGVLVFVTDGRLALLELWWIDTPIAEMPALSDVVVRRSSTGPQDHQ